MIIDTEVVEKMINFIERGIKCNNIECVDCKKKYGNLEHCPKSYGDDFYRLDFDNTIQKIRSISDIVKKTR